MGIFKQRYGHLAGTDPDPTRFGVARTEQVGPHLVASIVYHGVTNYEGFKTIVFKDLTAEELKAAAEVDPHFRKPVDPVAGPRPFARFEPTDEGWAAAIAAARSLAEVD